MASAPWAAMVAGLLALPAACELPRDPGGTLEALRGGTLDVAVVAPALTPAEQAALDAFAQGVGATLRPVPMDLHEAVAQMGARRPDGWAVVAAVGSIPAGTPHAQEAAATREIGRERFVILLPPGENALLLAANRAVGDAEAARRGARTAAP